MGDGEGIVDEVPEWVHVLGLPVAWPVLIFATAICFWSLSAVCEERFVPALAVICEKGKIPDDVAGATMMAAGASAPEVFASLIALFITHSSLGVGTVVGSEIFNHLIICAGSVLCARGGVLRLDRKIVLRESAYYLLALVLLLVILTHEKSPSDTIVIRLPAPLVLVSCYIAYVFTCVYYDAIVDVFLRTTTRRELPEATAIVVDASAAGDTRGGGSDKRRDGRKSFLRGASGVIDVEPAENFQDAPAVIAEAHDKDADDGGGYYSAVVNSLVNNIDNNSNKPEANSNAAAEDAPSSAPAPKTTRAQRRLSASQLRPRLQRRASSRMSLAAQETVSVMLTEMRDLIGMPNNRLELEYMDREPFACYLFKSNHYYNGRSHVTSARAWELRWIEVLGEGRLGPGFCELVIKHSFDDTNADDVARGYVLISARVADKRKLLIECELQPLGGPDGKQVVATEGAHHVFFLAPSKPVCEAFEACVRAVGVPEKATALIDAEPLGVDEAPEESLMAWPHGARVYNARGLGHIIVFPLKVALHYTLYDVRQGAETMPSAVRACVVCIAWLAVLSLAMCYCCESLGAIMGLSDAIVGITFSAVGTSLPNLISSMVVSQKGLGNMAVSNALGSNTFNIFVGLGVPWALYCAIFGVYDTLPSDDVIVPVFILILTLVIFLAILVTNDFCLHKRHAYLFTALYALFLCYAIAMTFMD